MSNTTNSDKSQSRRSQKTDLLQALNAAAGSLQRSARSRQAVFQAFEEQAATLGWNGSIMLLSESGQHLSVNVLAYSPNQLKILHQLAQRFNMTAIGFTFPLSQSPFYQQLVQSKSPRFTESNNDVIRELLPEYGRSIMKSLLTLLGDTPAIFAPIISGDKIQGILNIGGADLTKEEIPAVEAFANHIAIALENADLFSALEASKSRQRLLFNQASDGIFVFDENNYLIDVNRSGCQMLGFTPEALLGKSYEALISPQNIKELPLQPEELHTDNLIVIQRFLLRQDGSQVAVEISAKRLPDKGMQAVVRDITARLQSEKALRRRENILEAIAFAAGQFLRLPSWEDGIDEVLSLLGIAADVSRVYIFKNYLGENDELFTSQQFEWTGPGITAFINDPDLASLPLEASGFGRWVQEMTAGRNIYGDVASFPETEQKILQLQGILSMLVVPIYCNQAWWGFIGFDECTIARQWGTSEIDALQAAAWTIGGAIERQWINQQERQRRQEAEMLMSVTTALTSTLNLEQLLNSILVHLRQVVPFVSACIFLIEDNMMRAVAGYELPNSGAIINQVFSVTTDKFIPQMIESRQPVILEDAQKDENFNAWGETNYVSGWMGVPLVVREKVIGYVTLDSDKVGAYGEKEARLAQAFVNQAAIAIENAKLFDETQRLLGQTRQQTGQLQQIMNIVPDGILLLDPQKRVALANQAGAAYLDRVAEILEDGRLTQIGQYSLEALYQPVPSPTPWLELKSHDGRLLFEAAVWPLDRNREDDYWVLVLQDITEERAKQSYRSAQERLAIVGQMAAGIAHDFNNIMAVILLYAQLLLQMPDLPAKEEKRLVTIVDQSRRASELIHQILDFSRQSLLERKPLSFQPLIKELTYLLKRTLPENIEVILNNEEGQFLINGDPTRIQQSIMNLALNARDAMPDGGSLKLSLKELNILRETEKPLPDMSKGKWLQLQVADSGSGISAENLHHIFEPFFTTKPIGRGTGLGLAQVYGIVKQHEGFIDVQSAPGKGTTFSIYLPAFEPKAELLLEPMPELPKADNHETILVVEDNENARVAVVEILEMLNYKTLSAANGVDALAIFQSHEGNIDLVLSDVVMPLMDGTALHQALTKIKPEIKMIMMTGYPLEDSGKALLKQNVVAWMHKPLHTEQIAKTVFQALYETSD